MEFVGTTLKFEDVLYKAIPQVGDALPFLRIDKVGDKVRILKTEGFLGDFGDNHRFDFKIHREVSGEDPHELHTGSGDTHKVTVYTGIKDAEFLYAIEGMEDGDIRITHSVDFLKEWRHLDVAGYLFTRVVS
jgi:hypothetical protein